ncbi:MAG: cell wall hydrolase [Geminicoccaceae bacterium]
MRRLLGGMLAALLLAWSVPGHAFVADSARDEVPGSLNLMALNMYQEAGGEGDEGMLAVGWVVLNRVADPSYPKTIEGVISQGCQFSWRCDGRSDAPRSEQRWRRALDLARTMLEAPPPDPTGGAISFHNTFVSPDWHGLRRTVQIGNHVFYARPDGRARSRDDGFQYQIRYVSLLTAQR